MSNDIVKKMIRTVVKIYLDAGVRTIPTYKEIHEEFEISYEGYITKGMIRETQWHIANYLDKNHPAVSDEDMFHVNELIAWWYRSDRSQVYPHYYPELDMYDE